ncbi:hypothetical protein J6590_029368, partial [Homalodisca vitripennis]
TSPHSTSDIDDVILWRRDKTVVDCLLTAVVQRCQFPMNAGYGWLVPPEFGTSFYYRE